jgi:hypothetical protein
MKSISLPFDRLKSRSRSVRTNAFAFDPAPVAAVADALLVSPYRDVACAAGTAAGAFVWVKLFDLLTAASVLEQVRALCATEGSMFVLTRVDRRRS